MTRNRHVYLYEKISYELSQAIHQGIYQINERLPSLRHVSEQYKVSLATAIQAYHCLEQEGLIESRPKSGYYVSAWAGEQPDEPAISQSAPYPSPVNVGHLALSLVNEAHQPGLIKLGAAVPQPELLPLGTLSRTLAGIARRNIQAPAGYEQTQGNIALRKQIARLMRESGVNCNANEIIITNGCLEALGLALRAVATSGDTIAIESPTYFGILQVIESLGMQALEISTHPSDGIDPQELQKAVKQRKIAACVLMPTFNNPLGSTMPEENKQQIAELLSQHNIALIEDDVYGALSFESRRPKAVKSYDYSGNVLYCSSFSKTISPGLRVGWIIAGRYLEKVIYQKFLDNIGTAIHPQLTMAEFLSKGSYRRHVRLATRTYRQRMEQLRRAITEYFPTGTRISNPKGGFLLWVELPKKHNCLEIYRNAMEKKIAITPGILFSAQNRFQHHIRLSCSAVEGSQARISIRKLAKLL